MVPKQFTRICRGSLGRTPARHLGTPRMQEAGNFLSRTADEVEVIAREFGNHSPFTFSHAFKKLTDHRPGGFRRR